MGDMIEPARTPRRPRRAPKVAIENVRNDRAKRFAYTASQLDYGNIGCFIGALRHHLAAHDVARPDEAHLPVNERQCIAIYLAGRATRSKRRAAS